jgi:hypothetical protein
MIIPILNKKSLSVLGEAFKNNRKINLVLINDFDSFSLVTVSSNFN